MELLMGFTGSHEHLIFIIFCNPYVAVFAIKSDAQQSNNPALSVFSHLFLSIPSCTRRQSLAYFPSFCPIV